MEKYKKLFLKKYPEIISPVIEIDIDSGWFSVVDRLLYNVNDHIKGQHNLAKLEQTYFFFKIKYTNIIERKGGLIIINKSNVDIELVRGMEIISQAWASVTCSKCGSPGIFREYSKINKHFIDRTFCNDHHEEEVLKLDKKLRNG